MTTPCSAGREIRRFTDTRYEDGSDSTFIEQKGKPTSSTTPATILSKLKAGLTPLLMRDNNDLVINGRDRIVVLEGADAIRMELHPDAVSDSVFVDFDFSKGVRMRNNKLKSPV